MGRNQEYKMTISKEELLRIYEEDYSKGLSTIDLEDKYGVNRRYFSSWFKKLGLEMRTNKINSRRYFANDNYFSEIDSSQKAYWLGFMYADGYVSSTNGKRVGLSLSIKDKSHLETFIRCLNSNYPINEYKVGKNSYNKESKYGRVLFSSDKMYDDLVSLGVTEHKTNDLKPPVIKNYLKRYFILGYFDRDGSIFLNKGRSPFYSISIVGTDDMCNFIGEYLISAGIIERYKIEKRKKEHIVSYIRFGGNLKVSKIMSHLYQGIDTDIVLKRKYELFEKCKNKNFK